MKSFCQTLKLGGPPPSGGEDSRGTCPERLIGLAPNDYYLLRTTNWTCLERLIAFAQPLPPFPSPPLIATPPAPNTLRYAHTPNTLRYAHSLSSPSLLIPSRYLVMLNVALGAFRHNRGLL